MVQEKFAPARRGSAPRPGLEGCPVHDLRARLRAAGLRPTRQRVALGWLLFGRGHRHVTAEQLYDEAARARCQVSLATVYNALNHYTRAGLLREIVADGARSHFDTNVSKHHHFLVEATGELIDIAEPLDIPRAPVPPAGMEIASVDVVVRLRPRRR